MKKKLEIVCLILFVITFAVMLSRTLEVFTKTSLAGDEAIFIRITDNLPAYRSYPEWYTRDGKINPDDWDALPPSPFYWLAYNDPIWSHPPVANYIAYPAVKLLWSDDSIATIDKGTENLRRIAWGMFVLSILGAIYLVRRKSKSNIVLLLSVAPFIVAYPLFTMKLQNWFYHDIFMLTFLVTALLMRETKYRKFIYIPLALMVGSKLSAIFLLIPFVLENKKTILCSLILVPYLIQSYFASGNFFYPYWHYLNATNFSNHNTLQLFVQGIKDSSPILAVTVLPLGYKVYKAIIKEGSWFLPALFLTAFGSLWFGGGGYKLPLLIITGMILVGETAAQVKFRRTQKRGMENVQVPAY